MYEIEHKYLVDSIKFDKFLDSNDTISKKILKQGYVIDDSRKGILRVRITDDGIGYFTYKKQTDKKETHVEVETTIPIEQAEFLFKSCDKKIDKTRYVVKVGEHDWDVDVFHGKLDGLVIAEVEINDEEEEYIRPNWAKMEITQSKLSNYYLASADPTVLKMYGVKQKKNE